MEKKQTEVVQMRPNSDVCGVVDEVFKKEGYSRLSFQTGKHVEVFYIKKPRRIDCDIQQCEAQLLVPQESVIKAIMAVIEHEKEQRSIRRD